MERVCLNKKKDYENVQAGERRESEEGEEKAGRARGEFGDGGGCLDPSILPAPLHPLPLNLLKLFISTVHFK